MSPQCTPSAAVAAAAAAAAHSTTLRCAVALLIIYVAWIFHGSESRKVASKGVQGCRSLGGEGPGPLDFGRSFNLLTTWGKLDYAHQITTPPLCVHIGFYADIS